jgi:manganese efflux pump family protein
MDILTLFFVAFALAMDAFAVSISAGAYLIKADARQTFRLAFHFGLFQFMMPVIGWFAGSSFAGLIASVDHWIAFGLLAVIGGKMVVESFSNEHDAVHKDVSRGWSLISLSIATSIDALAVGLSLSMLNAEIISPSLIIGIVAGGMSFVGIRIGEKASHHLGRHMEFIGGVIVILIGARILAEHLLGA